MVIEKSSYGGFSTNSFYLASFLFSKRFKLLGIDKSDARRMEFVFADSEELRSDVEAFNFADLESPKLLVDARQFVVAIKSLKERMYQA